MSLNIKNAETHRLARELAALTGESMTGAITVALREALSERNVSAASRPESRGCGRYESAPVPC